MTHHTRAATALPLDRREFLGLTAAGAGLMDVCQPESFSLTVSPLKIDNE